MLQAVWLHFLEFNELEILDCTVRGRYKRYSWLLGNDSRNKKMKNFAPNTWSLKFGARVDNGRKKGMCVCACVRVGVRVCVCP